MTNANKLINRNTAGISADYHHDVAASLGDAFQAYLDEFHSYREPYDDELDAQLHEAYAKIKRVNKFANMKWGVPNFSPSAAGSSLRDLYEKVRKSKKDETRTPPHQRRWTAQGTALGDWLQRELLLAEKHYPKFTGKPATFRLARTTDGYPAFEDFIYRQHTLTYEGVDMALMGTSDGIMEYVTEDGEVLTVGLEIKSKQTTAARTKPYSLSAPEPKHIDQCTVYSIMYGLDYFVITYVNASKKSWAMTPEEYAENPDVRAFGVYITEEMRKEVLDRFAGVVKAVKANTPPPVDLHNWTFNNHKQAIVDGLTDAEIAQITQTYEQTKKSRLPEYKKKPVIEAYEEITKLRGGAL